MDGRTRHQCWYVVACSYSVFSSFNNIMSSWTPSHLRSVIRDIRTGIPLSHPKYNDAKNNIHLWTFKCSSTRLSPLSCMAVCCLPPREFIRPRVKKSWNWIFIIAWFSALDSLGWRHHCVVRFGFFFISLYFGDSTLRARWFHPAWNWLSFRVSVYSCGNE